MFEQIFKNIDNELRKDAGCSSELDYVEQTSWILFLKYLDDLEKEKKVAEELAGKTYESVIAPEFQWSVWAVPKGKDGKLDHHKAMTGDDLVDFVNQKLFPYLKKFKLDSVSADTIQYKIGEIFSELKNRIQSGYNLREVINLIDELKFGTSAEKHEMSHLYEAKIQNMGNAGRNGGEYYTPRPLIKTIVKVVKPEIGNKIYDGAVGSAGFLCEAFNYLNHPNLSTVDDETLQKKTFYGKEKKSLAYIIGIMNMIFHGISSPNITHTNTLAENITDIQEKDRYDVVLANPPFGGKERAEVQQNFPIKTSETAFLFLQHFIKILKAGGRAGVVIKNTFLSNTDNASVSLRRHLLENCNLHTILDMPQGTFLGAGVKTVVLFFEKGKPTQKVWYYQLNLDRNLGKTNPLNEKDLEEFVHLQKTFADSDNSWSVNVADIDTSTFDLSVKNPNKKEKVIVRDINEILTDLEHIRNEKEIVFKSLNEMNSSKNTITNIPKDKLGSKCDVIPGQSPESKYYNSEGEGLPFYQGKKEFGDKYISEPVKWTSKVTKEALKDDILISVRAPVGPVNFAKERCCIGRGLAAIRVSKEIDVEFLYNYLKTHTELILGNKGAVFDSINRDQIKNIDIPVPPLNLQLEIVRLTNSINKLTNELKRLSEIELKLVNELELVTFRKAFKGELREVSS